LKVSPTLVLFCIAVYKGVFIHLSLQVKIIFGLTGGKLRLCSSKDGTNVLSDLKESDVLKLHASTVFAIMQS